MNGQSKLRSADKRTANSTVLPTWRCVLKWISKPKDSSIASIHCNTLGTSPTSTFQVVLAVDEILIKKSVLWRISAFKVTKIFCVESLKCFSSSSKLAKEYNCQRDCALEYRRHRLWTLRCITLAEFLKMISHGYTFAPKICYC